MTIVLHEGESYTRADGEVTEEQLAFQRLHWYMLLRWLGVAVLYSAGIAARIVADHDYSLTPSNVLAPLALAYNVVVWRLVTAWQRRPPANWRVAYRVLGNAQCSADLTVLAVALHFSGGIEALSPGLALIAVLVVAGLVLPPRDSFAQGVLTCLLFDGVVIAEATGLLGHIELGTFALGQATNARLVAAQVVLYDAVVLFIVFLVVFLASRLRQRETEIARLYQAEHRAVTRLQELDRLKSEFLATVSHELRTPLTAISGFSKNLATKWELTADSARRDQIDVISRQSERLRHLVEDLLDLSAVEAGTLHVQAAPVRIDVAIEAAISSSGLHGVERRIEPGLVALADPRRTEQVLVSLLDNARKYGAPPVSVEAVASDGDVVLSVLDRGAGIPDARAAEVFERFSQLDHGVTRASSGVGLGLALARGYVEAQGGTIGYQSLAGGGSRFSFTLPLHGG